MDRKKIQAAVSGAYVAILGACYYYLQKVKRSRRLHRQPHIRAHEQRDFYVNSLLSRGDRHCNEQLRMSPSVFHNLCHLLTENNLLQHTRNITIREQVMMFLQIVGFNSRFREISGRYYRSVETVHRYFKIVLKAVLKLYKHCIRDPDHSTPEKILNNERFYPYFKVSNKYLLTYVRNVFPVLFIKQLIQYVNLGLCRCN